MKTYLLKITKEDKDTIESIFRMQIDMTKETIRDETEVNDIKELKKELKDMREVYRKIKDAKEFL